MHRFVVAAAGLAVAASAASAQQLYFAEIFYPTLAEGSIQRVDVTGFNQQLVTTTGGGLRSIDVDAAAGKVYWTDVDAFAIRRANLDGSGQEDVVNSGLQFVTAVRLEHDQNRLWFGDATAETINYVPLPGGGPILWGGFAFFTGLALDAGEIFFSTSITPTSGNLYRSTTAGPPLPPIITTGKPQSVAIDRAGGKVYYTDAATRAVKRANLDGSNIQTIYTDPSGFKVRGIAVDPAGGKVYWGQDVSDEENLGAIYSANLDGSEIVPVLFGVGFVNDIIFVPGGGPAPCYANCDGSTQTPVLNVADFTCFLQRYAAGESYANCDNSTQPPVLNVADFTCFLQTYAAGCP